MLEELELELLLDELELELLLEELELELLLEELELELLLEPQPGLKPEEQTPCTYALKSWKSYPCDRKLLSKHMKVAKATCVKYVFPVQVGCWFGFKLLSQVRLPSPF